MNKLKKLIHSLGLSCLAGSAFLSSLVFFDISSQGYFLAIERNSMVLTVEILASGYGFCYLLYLWMRFLRQEKEKEK